MSLEKILKENPDVKITTTQFRSEEHFEHWFDKFRYALPAQIIKQEQGIYGTKIYYIYVPASKEIIIAEVPIQQNFVYTQDVIKQTVEQTKQKIQEVKSQGATHIEISSPKFEIKDNSVNVQMYIKGYKIEKIPQQNLYSSLNQNNQNNFNYFDFLKNEAMQSYYYKNLTYDPNKYINEYIIQQSKKLFGFAEYTKVIEKEADKEVMPPIPFIKEAWDAGVSIGNIVNAIFGKGKNIKVIEENIFEINIPKFYYQGTELKLSPIIIEKKEYIESRPVNILHEAASATKDLFIAFSPWILQKIKIKISEPNEQIIQAYKEGKLVAIEKFSSQKELVKNPIFVKDLESYTKTNLAKEVFEKSRDIKLGIIEGFKEVPKEKLQINYLYTLGADRMQVIYVKAEEGKKLIDVIHIPGKGTFDVKETIQIYATKISGTKIKNIIYGTRKNILANIHFLGEKALGFKTEIGPMKPFNIQTTTTSQALQQSQKVLVPIVKEIQPITTTISKETSLITIPHTLTKIETKTQEMLDQKYYLPLVNTRILNRQEYKTIFASPYQLVNQQIANIQTKTPFNFQNLRNFQTNIQQNFITTPPISTTTTSTTTRITTTNINIPQIKTPELSIRIPKISLPKFDNKKLEKIIEKPKQFKIFEEKIRFPSLYSLTFDIKTVNNKIAREIIRPLKL
ncbi:MAG: hypothetical protein QXL82_03125 [Candidatus Aenigmatarchaeota archaeon]